MVYMDTNGSFRSTRLLEILVSNNVSVSFLSFFRKRILLVSAQINYFSTLRININTIFVLLLCFTETASSGMAFESTSLQSIRRC